MPKAAPTATEPQATEAPKTKKPRVIRTPEQQIADLEAKIAATKCRAARTKAKENPSISAMLRSLGSIDNAISVSAGKYGALGALGGARDVIRDYLIAQGINL